MPYASKRPCCTCHRWFRPNNRVGFRQRACSRPDCQRLRHQRNQAEWVAWHPDYFAGRRIQDRVKLDPPPKKALRLPSPLHQLPWDIAQDQFGAQGADLIGVMGALLVRFAQDKFAGYCIDSNRDPYQIGGWRRNTSSSLLQSGVVEADRLDMRLEFHQLERRLEHLRVHRPEAQRRLLASLAVNGQQMPIVVVAAGQADRYLVIDGYQRIRALEQLGRDTVEAVVWTLNEPEALLLDRTLRWGEHDTALEEGRP